MVIRAFGAAPIRDRAEILLGAMPHRAVSLPVPLTSPTLAVREQIPSIIVTIVFVVVLFLLLGWWKALEIRDGGLGFPG